MVNLVEVVEVLIMIELAYVVYDDLFFHILAPIFLFFLHLLAQNKEEDPTSSRAYLKDTNANLFRLSDTDAINPASSNNCEGDDQIPYACLLAC